MHRYGMIRGGIMEMGPDLPAYSTLVFDVELVKVFPYVEPAAKK